MTVYPEQMVIEDRWLMLLDTPEKIEGLGKLVLSGMKAMREWYPDRPTLVFVRVGEEV